MLPDAHHVSDGHPAAFMNGYNHPVQYQATYRAMEALRIQGQGILWHENAGIESTALSQAAPCTHSGDTFYCTVALVLTSLENHAETPETQLYAAP